MERWLSGLTGNPHLLGDLRGKKRPRFPGPTVHSSRGLIRMSPFGITSEVWRKWKKKQKKLGTLTMSVGGFR